MSKLTTFIKTFYMQTIERSITFDSMHRVMNEAMQCFNVHGHTYKLTLAFTYATEQEIGYAIDFKEIKRVFLQFVLDHFDHAAILNPKDIIMISTCKALKSKMWIMSLRDDKYCNPTVENIAKELAIIIELLVGILYKKEELMLFSVKLDETPTCSTTFYCTEGVENNELAQNVINQYGTLIGDYARRLGRKEYDDRKLMPNGDNNSQEAPDNNN